MISAIDYCILVDDFGNELSVAAIRATLSVYKNSKWVDPIPL
jgi:hypothetical protein